MRPALPQLPALDCWADGRHNRAVDDVDLLRRAEAVLSEIDRTQGLSDEHAEVLAALRIRLHGAPRKTLDDVLKAAGDLKGKVSLDNPPPPPKKGSLEDVLRRGPSKREWPGP